MSFHVFQSQGYLVDGETESHKPLYRVPEGLKRLSPAIAQDTWGAKGTESRQSTVYPEPERSESRRCPGYLGGNMIVSYQSTGNLGAERGSPLVHR